MEILINLNDINESITQIKKNSKYFVIKDNLFSMDKIITLKKPEKKENVYNHTSFEFSYNDGCKNDIIKVIYMHEDISCYSFVKTCKIISENEINQIYDNASKIAEEKVVNRINKEILSIFDKECDIDNIFYNEVLVYISSKINENDKSDLKDDFISKYEMYKEKKQAIIDETNEAINKLYKKIIDIKLIG